MRKIKLYIATSLNGKIASKDGAVDWLESIPNPDALDYGYADFYKSVDATIQGNSTYQQILSWGIDFPYAGKQNYVLSRTKHENTEHVEFISDNQIEFIQELKKQSGGDIWLIGGGQVNTMLLNAKLIDEIFVFVMPIVLSEGIELFEAIPDMTHLTLKSSQTYPTGVVEMIYNL
ncbi:dihydrofolate reductase family protein [Carboxylicivirga sp. N1Y90]|uniref:dihydrofolate reductase family protein n=1 Tax=Carboxylicivirga fragile TaxID=3417571 RepID=UPI003D32FC09|nr:dihydrofolate reductase [Marinilabiliaceae bacterium N1Y90]